MLVSPLKRTALSCISKSNKRTVGTLSTNPHIYTFPHGSNSHYLSLLPTTPPTTELTIGTTQKLPPTPDSFTENPKFLTILQEVLKEHAHQDSGVLAQAQAFATNASSQFGPGGALFRKSRRGEAGYQARAGGGGGASSQGGAGGGGRGGWVHLSDMRNPPDFGRIAWPEDIFGSLEVDANGDMVDGGSYQPSGTYRIVTRDGILGLSDFLREKVVERLRSEEKKLRG